MRNLGRVGGYFDRALDINEAGQIAGESERLTPRRSAGPGTPMDLGLADCPCPE